MSRGGGEIAMTRPGGTRHFWPARPQHRAQRHSARGHFTRSPQAPGRTSGERSSATKFVVLSRIVRDPEVCGGQPIIRGTHVSVRLVLAYLAQGETWVTILRELPALTVDDVRT